MKKRCFVLIAAALWIGVAGLAGAQEGSTPQAVVQSLVDQGYLTSAGGTLAFQQASAEARSKKASGWTWLPLDLAPHTDFVMSASFARGSDDLQDGCGFIFRYRDDQHLYFVDFTGEGKVVFRGIYKQRGAPQETLTNAVRDSGSTPNQLTVIATGNTFQVLVNGTYAGLFQDPATLTNESGGIGVLSVSSTTSDRSFCTVSDLWVWDLDSGAASGPSAVQPTAGPTLTPRPTATPRPPEVGQPAGGHSSATRTPQPTSLPAANELAAYDRPMKDALAELVSLGVIPAGGSEIFQEPNAYFEGTGYWYTPLASFKPFTHIVMAGELNFTRSGSSETELCGLMARIITGGSVTNTYLIVGLSSDGELVALDMKDGEMLTGKILADQLDLSQPHHVLFAALRDHLDVYLDGVRVARHLAIEERSGTYGISLYGAGANARCEGHNLWAWEVDQVVEFGGQCGVRAANTVNLRGGPGTSYDRAGSLEAGQTALVVGQATGDDGFTWWKLDSGAWVRSDVVSVGGSCAAVPVVEP